MSDPLTGVWCAALTPMHDDLSVDPAAMVAHHQWLLGNGCDGVAVLGTTGEANSFAIAERLAVIEAAANSGIARQRLLIGTGCCAAPDTVALTRAALDAGFDQILMLPPFYYKGVGDDGLFAAYDQVIQQVADDRMRIVVYDFPKMTGLEIGTELLVRLHRAYPETVVGVKDSSGNWDDMRAVAEAIPGFRTFAGTEQYLLPTLRAGGAGCISATANVTARLCQRVYAAHLAGDGAGADTAQETATAVRLMLQAYPGIPSLKEIMAGHTGRAGWRNMRPPMLPLAADQVASLDRDQADLGFNLAAAA
ncbi:MAG: dihydrodipicolinate synthase family protein [Alphaproteobacteria bacterium]|jgi:4-hydroxy-tetrahydrodipicolinate synthase|nr:dihydrodipicolinate synthase family protein [Alphaproteobacteria bacterium]MDP6566107.1 dihydrodipicolinate synthase family protein [Alphaproteobacteria bacterium]MDP6811887.1 dihydrodipicolinate synthase family protein [Alphaproteobacteria bacterium]